MKTKTLILSSVITLFFSCEKDNKSTIENTSKETFTNKNIKTPSDKSIYSKYEYIDSKGKNLIIKNSFPKGGMKYKDAKGNQYVYAVFWTQITNETSNPLELNLDFLSDAYEYPASSGNYIRLLLPSDTLTTDKIPLFNYGLEVKSFLDNAIDKSSSLKRTINPNESTAFYVVTLSTKGVNGTLRTGLSIKGQNLYYKINDKEIGAGKINLKDLNLRR